MARKSTTGRGGKRRSYDPEKAAARIREDERVNAEATRALAEDGPAVGDWVRRTASGIVTGKLLRYSLRNQTMIMVQAAERGIDVTDVDTFRGWIARGRAVRRGETGLRIVQYRGGDQERADGAEPDTDADEREPVKETDRDNKFSMLSVFDISQTDLREGADAEDADIAEDAAGEPAEIVWNRLYEQIIGAGYAFDWPADDVDLGGRLVAVDHDASTVHVAMDVTADNGDALAALATALAGILTRRTADRRKASAPLAITASQAA